MSNKIHLKYSNGDFVMLGDNLKIWHNIKNIPYFGEVTYFRSCHGITDKKGRFIPLSDFDNSYCKVTKK